MLSNGRSTPLSIRLGDIAGCRSAAHDRPASRVPSKRGGHKPRLRSSSDALAASVSSRRRFSRWGRAFLALLYLDGQHLGSPTLLDRLPPDDEVAPSRVMSRFANVAGNSALPR